MPMSKVKKDKKPRSVFNGSTHCTSTLENADSVCTVAIASPAPMVTVIKESL